MQPSSQGDSDLTTLVETLVNGFKEGQLAEKPLVSHNEISLALKNGKQFIISVEEVERCQCGAISWKFYPILMGWQCQVCSMPAPW